MASFSFNSRQFYSAWWAFWNKVYCMSEQQLTDCFSYSPFLFLRKKDIKNPKGVSTITANWHGVAELKDSATRWPVCAPNTASSRSSKIAYRTPSLNFPMVSVIKGHQHRHANSTRTYIRSYIRTFIHTYIPAYIHIHTYIHTYIHSYKHFYIHAHTG